MEDIKRKSGDLNRVKDLSRELQGVLNVSSENMIILVCHLQLKYSLLGMHFRVLNPSMFKYFPSGVRR